MGQDITRFKSKQASCGLYSSNLAIEKKSGVALFLIDPQVDFVSGSLAIDGAKQDCIRTAAFILKNINDIDNIFISLDTHMQFHIAHKAFWWKKTLPRSSDKDHVYDWTKATKEAPANFDRIPHEAVYNHIVDEENDLVVKFEVRKDAFKVWGLYYTKTLEETSKKDNIPGDLTLTIWPDHCLIGSKGHTVEENVFFAIQEWERVNEKTAHFTIKGHNSKTEHYSALMAEVPISGDPETKFNVELYKSLVRHERIYCAGQARSHCVNHSVRHLVGRMEKDRSQPTTEGVILIDGSMSDVYQCEHLGEGFWKDMVESKKVKSTSIRGIVSDEVVSIKDMEEEERKALVESIPKSYLIEKSVRPKSKISKKPSRKGP